MSLILKTAATTTVSGGTDLTFVTQEQRNGTIVMVQSGADLASRRRLTSKISPPASNAKAPGGKQNARHEVTLGKPFVTANGDVGANSIQVSFSRHPELTSADADVFIDELVSGLVDSGTIRVLLKDLLQP